MMFTRRRLVLGAAAAAAVLGVLLAAVHLPAVQSRLLRWGLAGLTGSGIVATADRLSYNLLALDFQLHGLTAAAAGSENTPFLRVDELELNLPWRVVAGAMAVEAMQASGVEVTLIRAEDGTFNLPDLPEGDSPGTISRVDVGRLTLERVSLRYRDLASGWSVDVDELALDLAPSGAAGEVAGKLSARGPSARTADVAIEGRLSGELAYDGTNLTVAALTYDSAPGRLRVDGRLNGIWAEPVADLAMSGALSLEELSPILEVEPPPNGLVSVKGDVTGPLATVTAQLSVSSERLAWRHLEVSSLDVRATASADAVIVDAASLSVAAGTVRSNGSYDFPSARAAADVAWDGLRMAALLPEAPPVSVDSRLDGQAAVSWDVNRSWQGLTATATLQADGDDIARDALPLSGDLQLGVGDGEWRLAHDVEAATLSARGRIEGRLDGDDLLASTLGGKSDISGDDLPALVEGLRRAGAAVPESVRVDGGRIDAAVEVDGTIREPRARVEASLADLRTGGIGPVQAAAEVEADLTRLRVPRLEVSLGGNQALASGAIDLATGELDGDLKVTLADAAALGPEVRKAWQPAGRLTGRFDLGGTRSNPNAEGTIEGEGIRVAGQALDSLTSRIRFEDGTVRAESASLVQPDGGRLSIDGQYALETGRLAVDAQAAALRLSPLVVDGETHPVSAVVDGVIRGAGTLDRPEGSARLTATAVRWQDLSLDRALLDVEAAGGEATLRFEAPSLAASVEALVGVQSPYEFSATGAAEGTRIADLIRLAGVQDASLLADMDGQLRSHFVAAGNLEDLSSVSVEGNLDELEVKAAAAALRLSRPATFGYDGTRASIGQLQLEAGDFTIEALGEIGAPASRGLTLLLAGDVGELAPWAALAGAPAGVEMSGGLSGTISATGPLDRIQLSGDLRLDDGRVAWPGYPPATGAAFQARLQDDLLEVTDIRARWQDATAEGRLRVPLQLAAEWLPGAIVARLPDVPAVATLSARVDNITPAVLAPVAGAEIAQAIEGRAALELELRAEATSIEAVTGSLTLRDLELTAEGVPVRQVRPTRIDVGGAVARVTDWIWEVAGSRLEVRGTASLSGERPLDLTAAGTVDLRLLGAFIPDVTTGGLGEVSLRVRGPLDNPLADGFVQLQGGELLVTDPPLALVDARGRLVLLEDRIDLTGLEAELNGGRLTMIGGLQRSGFSVTGGAFSIEGRGILLEIEGLRSEVATALELSFADRIRLSGRVDVLRGAYREPLSLAAGLAAAARQRAAAADTTAETAAILARTDLDVAVASSQDLIVDNNYGRMDIGLDLRLVGTAARPAVIGRAIISEGGVLYLGGRTYEISQGVIDFTNPRAIVPDLDLEARTRVRSVQAEGSGVDYDITLSIAGSPDNLTTTLSSDPPGLAQADLVSLLATGRLADQAGGAGAAIATEQLLGYLSGEALGFVAQAIGVDALRLERGAGVEELGSDPSIAWEVDPAQRLTLSRQFSRYVNVVLSQNLSENGRLTWIATYTPVRALELRAISRDDRSRAYSLRHDVSFGARAPAVSSSAPRRLREERVAAVRFEGELAFDSGQLADAVALTEGDRFEFSRWQNDRERLRRFYLDRGYFEARVSARRIGAESVGGEDRVTLAYEIDAGPLTQLDVEGYRLPGDVRRELERIWSNAVIDVVLDAELASAVRRHLAGEGYLQAKVTTRRPPGPAAEAPGEPEEKTIAILVETGERTPRRSVRFEGNQRMEDAALRPAVTALGIDAWLTPRSLADEVARLYRQEGFLAATVRAGPIERADGAAVLPVRIEEGRQFTIASIDVSGAQRRSADEVRAAADLEAGQPYTAAAVERARAAAEADYSRQGFNAVSSTVDTASDLEAGTVSVTLQIAEGPRQVIEEVTIAGGQGVHPPVIADALDLEAGSPANLDAIFGGRRRLFDTGLFQRVNVEVVPIEGAAAPPGVEPVRTQVTLTRWPAWRLRYGFEVRDEVAPVSDQGRAFGAGASADVQRRDLFGRPGTFGGALRYNADQRIARAFVTVPTFFGRPIASSVFAARSRDLFEGQGFLSFISDRTALTLEQRLNAGRRLQLAYGYQIERNHVFDPEPDPGDPFALDDTFAQARLTATVLADTRDDPFDPRAGLFHSSSFEYGAEALGSDVRFIKYFLQQFAFVPIGRWITSASALRIGLGRGFGQRLIPSEQFFAGGANTVRGYPEDALAGFDFFGDPISGQAVVVLNQEIRVPVYRWIGAAGFVDAGQVYRDASDLSLTGLNAGVGAGLRLSTPFGLFRVDFGVPAPKKGREGRWYFGFGQTF